MKRLFRKLKRILKACPSPDDLFAYIAGLMCPVPAGAVRPVVYLVEDANWSIQWDGLHTTHHLQALGRPAHIGLSRRFQAGKILHYGSSSVFESQFHANDSKHNKQVVTFFHGKYGADPAIDTRFDLLVKHIAHIDAVTYANSVMRERFLALGIPDEKLFFVPIGVDPAVFTPLPSQDKIFQREEMGIPKDAFVVGSFQKDGNGWGEGLTPKHIKGPDIFLSVIEHFAKEHPVYVLLSGPARGYVKQGLETIGVPFQHHYFENPDDVAPLYQVLDAYLVTSREEGGPKAILESLASGVPLVTTDVGMARDVMEGHACGLICPSEDVKSLTQALQKIAQDSALAEQFRQNGLARVKAYDWTAVAQACETLYRIIETRKSPA